MKTGKIYIATVYEVTGWHQLGYSKMIDTRFARETLVYEYRFNKFYDLIENKKLKSKYSSNIEVSDEIVSTTTLKSLDLDNKRISKKDAKVLYLSRKKCK